MEINTVATRAAPGDLGLKFYPKDLTCNLPVISPALDRLSYRSSIYFAPVYGDMACVNQIRFL